MLVLATGCQKVPNIRAEGFEFGENSAFGIVQSAEDGSGLEMASQSRARIGTESVIQLALSIRLVTNSVKADLSVNLISCSYWSLVARKGARWVTVFPRDLHPVSSRRMSGAHTVERTPPRQVSALTPLGWAFRLKA